MKILRLENTILLQRDKAVVAPPLGKDMIFNADESDMLIGTPD